MKCIPYRLLSVPAILSMILALSGCGGKQAIKEQPPCEQRYSAAKTKFDEHKYEQAKAILQEILYRCSGSATTPDILYYLGLSDYYLEKYDQAEYHFRDLVRDYHTHALAEPAQFMIGRTLLAQSRSPDRDQSEAQKALEEFQGFLEDHPTGTYADSARFYIVEARDKMAQKEFQAGKLYFRLQEYKAASIYFRTVLDDFSDTKWMQPACYELASSLFREGKKDEALEVARGLQSGKIPDDLRRKTEQLIGRLEAK